MLVLTRKLGEVITIGEEVRITVVNIEGNQVKIGIDAPKHVKVHRAEIFERIRQENIEAARPSDLQVAELAHALDAGLKGVQHDAPK